MGVLVSAMAIDRVPSKRPENGTGVTSTATYGWAGWAELLSIEGERYVQLHAMRGQNVGLKALGRALFHSRAPSRYCKTERLAFYPLSFFSFHTYSTTLHVLR